MESTFERDAKIFEMHEKGIGYSQIADKSGLTKEGVHYVLEDSARRRQIENFEFFKLLLVASLALGYTERIARRAFRCLTRLGYTDIEQLKNSKARDFVPIKGLGRKSLDVVVRAMQTAQP